MTTRAAGGTFAVRITPVAAKARHSYCQKWGLSMVFSFLENFYSAQLVWAVCFHSCVDWVMEIRTFCITDCCFCERKYEIDVIWIMHFEIMTLNQCSEYVSLFFLY